MNELVEEVGRELRCTGQGCTIIYGHPEFISRAVLLRLVRFFVMSAAGIWPDKINRGLKGLPSR